MLNAVVGFVVKVWNFVVSLAPIVAHTVCEVTKGASDIAKIGGVQ